MNDQTTPSNEPRQVVFPDDRSLGMLSLVERLGSVQDRDAYQTVLGDAQGVVEVPADGLPWLRLGIHTDDASALRQLQPDDLQSVVWTDYHRAFGDADVLSLAALRGLKQLHLVSNRVSPQGLRVLSSLPGLQCVYLEKCRLDAQVFDDLAACTGLQRLTLRSIAPPAAPVGKLQNLPLTGLHLIMVRPDGDLTSLAHLTSLQRLTLLKGGLTDRDLDFLRSLAELESLCLSHHPRLTPAGLEVLRDHPRLKRLNLYQCEKIDDSVVDVLLSLPRLHDLVLGQTACTPAVNEAFAGREPYCVVSL